MPGLFVEIGNDGGNFTADRANPWNNDLVILLLRLEVLDSRLKLARTGAIQPVFTAAAGCSAAASAS